MFDDTDHRKFKFEPIFFTMKISVFYYHMMSGTIFSYCITLEFFGIIGTEKFRWLVCLFHTHCMQIKTSYHLIVSRSTPQNSK